MEAQPVKYADETVKTPHEATQEAISVSIRNQLELIRERADRIGGTARTYRKLLTDRADEDLYDTVRNIAGAIQLAATALDEAIDLRFPDADGPCDPPPWAV